jgi:hypothetical protein
MVLALAIFLLAFSVRVLTWHDTRLEVGRVQTVVTADYQRVARLLSEGGLRGFFSPASQLADPNNLGHPPGYSFLLAFIHSIFGQSHSPVQFVQIVCDALSAVLICLIVAELVTVSAGVVAGALAAFSPQLAWNSVLLLPDSISVFPILLAVYFVVHGIRRPRLWPFVVAGALVGISCWLRANAMLLTFFFAGSVLLLSVVAARFGSAEQTIAPSRAWRYALVVVAGTLLVVLPLTVRNAMVFHRFIPISLGGGQTFLEGIADYDPAGRFGIPRTDMGIMKQEAEIYHRPDYFGTLFNPDGVDRERARLARGFAVVRTHPFWFAGVMARRALSMVRLERARLTSRQPAITNAIRSGPPTTVVNADELLSQKMEFSTEAKLAIVFDGQDITFSGGSARYGPQVGWPLNLKQDRDYLVQVPVRMARGRMRLSIIDPNGAELATAVAETAADVEPATQPITLIQLPFVANDAHPRLLLSNEAMANPLAQMGPLEIYELGPAHFLWTRYPRLLIHGIQRMFLTAVILPLAAVGLLLLVWRKRRVALLILLMVPVYFFTVQSAVHTEYRYVLAVDYFLFAFAGVSLACIGKVFWSRARSWPHLAVPVKSR